MVPKAHRQAVHVLAADKPTALAAKHHSLRALLAPGSRRAAAQLGVFTAYMCVCLCFCMSHACAGVPMMFSSECLQACYCLLVASVCLACTDNSVIQAGLMDCVCSRCHSSPLLPSPCTQAAISSLALTVNRAAHHDKTSAQQK